MFSVASGREDLLEETITTKQMGKDVKYHPFKTFMKSPHVAGGVLSNAAQNSQLIYVLLRDIRAE